jgi:general secretion pathway protein G
MLKISRKSKFSLIELIVVVLILGVLAAAASLKLFDYLGDSKVTQAKTDIQTFAKAAELFRMDQGRYPEELPELLGVETDEGKGKSYVKKINSDPWGNDYSYSLVDEGEYEIISYGRDGEEGGEGLDTDITNLDSDDEGEE